MGKQYVVPKSGMVITEDTTFLPGVYYFFEEEGITIGASHITLDGNGAVFIGGKKKEKNKESHNKNEFSYGYSKLAKDDSLGFHGIAVYSRDAENVTIKNLSAKNFEIGLKLENCQQFKIYNNDFSYNYHNPDHGWDEHEDLGGIVLDRSHHCMIEYNKAMNVWSALTIRNGNHNIVKRNHFSHTSNVGLRLWHASENEFYENDFSWGIRKEPYEVHARDSSSVLIETGSNNNKFIKNDMRFGGDGLFIRSLNGWMSTGNYFEENDTSFANNNAIEAWDEGNTYIRNKANFSSYGFWLGNSDNTVLMENEVSYNGVNFKNAPENFGNAGIAVVNGSGTNFRVIGNKIHHNNGPGIAIRNKVDYPSTNWVIEENEIFENKSDNRGFIGHGIYLKYAKNIILINNKIYGNDGEPVFLDEYVGDVKELQRNEEARDLKVRIKSSSKTFVVAKEYDFSAEINLDANLELNFQWDFGDGESYYGKTIRRTFDQPGFYRISVSVNDGENVGFDTIHAYVLANGLEMLNEEMIEDWSVESQGDVSLTFNKKEYVSGNGSFMLQANGIKDITLKYPRQGNMCMDASDYTHFSFCLRYFNEMIDWYKENKTPTIRFCKDKENYVEFTPKPNLFGELANKYNESKYNWVYLEIDLQREGLFFRKRVGDFDFTNVRYLEIDVDNQLSQQSILMLSGQRFISKKEHDFINIANLSKYLHDPSVTKIVEVSSEGEGSNALAPLSKSIFLGDFTKRWISTNELGSEFYQINFGSNRSFNQVVIDFYQSSEITFNHHNEKLPQGMTLEYFSKGQWHDIPEGNREIVKSHHVLTFAPVIGSKLRLTLEGGSKPFSIYNIELNHTHNKLELNNIKAVKTKGNRPISIDKVGVKLNYTLHDWNVGISDLIVSLHQYDEDLSDSKELNRKELNWKDIQFKKETVIDMAVSGLGSDKNYYLAMTQKDLAQDLTLDHYFRWAGSGISKMDGSYGYINQDGLVNDEVGWGSNWLKVYTDHYLLDQSHFNDTLGNRFGLVNMEKIYQTIKLEHPIHQVLEGSIAKQSKVKIRDEEIIEISLKKNCIVDKLVLSFSDDIPRNVEVNAEGLLFIGINNENMTEVHLGKNVSHLTIAIIGNIVLEAIEFL
ncbi:right-handed parallel beta-helix repeat-containing protein [Pseudoneobacillus sp. C159]